MIYLGISYYECLAKPRIITDISKLNIDANHIENLIKFNLRCPICLNVYNNPVCLNNCLHKFCNDCIKEYHRKFKKECAVCRTICETKRHMIFDSNLSSLSKKY